MTVPTKDTIYQLRADLDTGIEEWGRPLCKYPGKQVSHLLWKTSINTRMQDYATTLCEYLVARGIPATYNRKAIYGKYITLMDGATQWEVLEYLLYIHTCWDGIWVAMSRPQYVEVGLYKVRGRNRYANQIVIEDLDELVIYLQATFARQPLERRAAVEARKVWEAARDRDMETKRLAYIEREEAKAQCRKCYYSTSTGPLYCGRGMELIPQCKDYMGRDKYEAT